MNPDEEQARAATLTMLAQRATDATVCPSEVARYLAREGACEDWRQAMPVVHAAVDDLLASEVIQLRWKGTQLETRAGPYRIAHPSSSEDES